MSMGRTAAYARVSTEEQHPENQLWPLARYATYRGLLLLAKNVYVDVVTGRDANRPSLDRLMGECRAHRVQTILCTKLDRLGRSVANLKTLCDELDELGVQVVFTEQSIDTKTAQGRFFFHILAAFAEFERDVISDRTKAGLARAAKVGRFPGRKRVFEFDDSVARSLRAQRMSWTGIANRLGVPRGAIPSIRRACRKEEASTSPTAPQNAITVR